MYITVSRAFRPWASDAARAGKESERRREKERARGPVSIRARAYTSAEYTFGWTEA